jgi:serine/threonine protein phosphatase PrpC
MGGMRDGAECAKETLAAVIEALVLSRADDLGKCLSDAIWTANHKVYDRYRGEGGSTISAFLVDKNGVAAIGNVGDSRIYRFIPGSGSALQLTVDDTLEAQLRQAAGKAADDFHDPERGRLIQFIGIGRDLSPHIEVNRVSPESAYLLTSDGIHGMGNDLVSKMVAGSASATEATGRLATLSNWLGGYDNATAICAFPDTLEKFVANRSQKETLLTIWTPVTQCEFIVPEFAAVHGAGLSDGDHFAQSGLPSTQEAEIGKPAAQIEKKRERTRSVKKQKKPKQLSGKSRSEKTPEKAQMRIKFIQSNKRDDD